MMRSSLIACALAALLLARPAHAQPAAVTQVYTAALHLGTPATTPEAVMAAPGAKRLHVVMLRDIDASELGRSFTRGMQDNAPKEEFSKSISGTLRMADIFSAKKRLTKGESFSVDHVPGIGTQVLVNGKPAGEPIAEPEFFRALIGIWLGPNPADNGLKQALLGACNYSKPAEALNLVGQIETEGAGL